MKFIVKLRYELNVAPNAGVRRERKNGVAVIITGEISAQEGSGAMI